MSTSPSVCVQPVGLVPSEMTPEYTVAGAGPPPSINVAAVGPLFVTLFDPVRKGVVNTVPSGRVTFTPFKLSVAELAVEEPAIQVPPIAAAASKTPLNTPRHVAPGPSQPAAPKGEWIDFPKPRAAMPPTPNCQIAKFKFS